jgi:hypothetical protein
MSALPIAGLLYVHLWQAGLGSAEARQSADALAPRRGNPLVALTGRRGKVLVGLSALRFALPVVTPIGAARGSARARFAGLAGTEFRLRALQFLTDD